MEVLRNPVLHKNAVTEKFTLPCQSHSITILAGIFASHRFTYDSGHLLGAWTLARNNTINTVFILHLHPSPILPFVFYFFAFFFLTAGFVHESTICLSDCGTFRTWTKTWCCYPLGGKRKFKRIWSLLTRNAELWWSPRKHNSGIFKRIQLLVTLPTLKLYCSMSRINKLNTVRF